MSTQQDFGTPDATDIMVAIDDAYFARGALIVTVRDLLSGIPREKAIAILQAVLIQWSSALDA